MGTIRLITRGAPVALAWRVSFREADTVRMSSVTSYPDCWTTKCRGQPLVAFHVWFRKSAVANAPPISSKPRCARLADYLTPTPTVSVHLSRERSAIMEMAAWRNPRQVAPLGVEGH